MIDSVHFIAGLPRSGSTLLSAILRQNPRFHAGMSSPLEHVYTSAITSMSGQNFFHHFMTNEQRKRILCGLFENYYADSKDVIFDTNRNWPSKLPSLVEIFPKAKMICCVRDLVSIFNSFEHLALANPYTVSRLFGWDAKVTVFGRYEKLAHPDGPVGRALAALRDGFYGPHSSRIHIVEYDDLVSSPEEVISSIYSAIGEAPFKHDFDNVEYEAAGFDEGLDFPGMHTVRKKIGTQQKSVILPPEIVERLRGAEFWRKKNTTDKGFRLFS